MRELMEAKPVKWEVASDVHHIANDGGRVSLEESGSLVLFPSLQASVQAVKRGSEETAIDVDVGTGIPSQTLGSA